MLHVRSAERRETKQQRGEEKVFSFSTLNYFLVNAVSTMFVTNCTLAEPFVERAFGSNSVRKALFEILCETSEMLESFV